MRDWLQHPRYVGAREALVKRLRAKSYRFRRLQQIAFLCGAANSARRDDLRSYLAKFRPDLLIFYAEPIWEQIAKLKQLSALEMEAFLAELADIVVVIVESPGTFAELGAFSLSTELRRKVLPILDKRFETSPSFINSGPVAWVNQDSIFSPSIHVDLAMILEAAGEIDSRLNNIPPPQPTTVEDLARSPKHLLFFVCDLLQVIGPASLAAVQHYLAGIVGSPATYDVPSIIGVAEAMQLVESATIDGLTVYLRRRNRAQATPYHHPRFIDLPSERAKHLSILEAIESSRIILQDLRQHVA